MSTRNDNPKIFISYSWSSPTHEEFVLNLAERLMSDGVHVIFDKWDLKEGHDKYVFMEQMVVDESVSKVLIISDKKYANKADKRAGGVGTESQIISDEIYTKVEQDKFIPIVTEYEDAKPCLPIFLKTRIYIDLSNENIFYDEYEKLLRNIYERRKIAKPAIGKAPSYLFEDTVRVETTSIFLNLKNAIEKEKKSTRKLSDDFLNQIIDSLESMRITVNADDFDDSVVKCITNFKPYRDQFVEYTRLLCSFDLIEDYSNDIFEFFEKLLTLHEPPKSMNCYNELQFDNFKFISLELFLYFITCLIKAKKYKTIEFFLNEKYYISAPYKQKTKNFYTFSEYIETLEVYRKQRLKLNRISITADILHDAADIKGINFDDIMQTDLILCLRSVLHSCEYYDRKWFPRTLVYKGIYSHRAFELFLRAESKNYFEVIKQLLNIKSKQDLCEKLDSAYKIHNLHEWRFDYQSIPFTAYINLDNLYDDKTG